VSASERGGAPDPRRVLQRAAALARQAPVPGWRRTAAEVVAAARTIRRPGTPIAAAAPGGTVWVSDAVLRSAIRAAVARVRGASPVSVGIDVAGDRVASISVGIAVVYGRSIDPVVDGVHRATRQMAELLLGPLVPGSDITVRVVDVVLGEDLPTR